MTLYSSLSDTALKPDLSTETLLGELVDVVQFLHQQGWTPATSSNFSCRNTQDRFYVSVSGKDKGQLSVADFIAVNQAAEPIEGNGLKPSAETLLHALIYRHYPHIKSVLHTHSVNATVLSKLEEHAGQVVFKDFEILKALEGIITHKTEVVVPVFPNDQNMYHLACEIETYLVNQTEPVYGLLLAGHGLYTWGETPAQAKRHVEAFEFLMDCVLKLKSYGYADYS